MVLVKRSSRLLKKADALDQPPHYGKQDFSPRAIALPNPLLPPASQFARPTPARWTEVTPPRRLGRLAGLHAARRPALDPCARRGLLLGYLGRPIPRPTLGSAVQ